MPTTGGELIQNTSHQSSSLTHISHNSDGQRGTTAQTPSHTGLSVTGWTCSGNGTQERAVQDLICLVDLYLVYLI